MKQPPKPVVGIVSLGLALVLLIVLLMTHHDNTNTKTFVTPARLQTALWDDYKQHYVQASGQVTDPQNNNQTTSEAESYTMLRAVWQNDRPTFDHSWQWTSQHLQRPDKLFSWQWGARSDGSQGILSDQGGENTASDADTDIALALLMADAKWRDSSYLQSAKQVIPAIWDGEVMMIHDQPYLLSDNLEPASQTPQLNPSYYAPYAYRMFAKVDVAHNWGELAKQSFQTVRTASQEQLGESSSANLPPDWVTIDRTSGQLSASSDQGHDTNFGFDAFRTVWRTALDYQWSQSGDAKSNLASFSALTDFWNHDHKLYAIYSHDGKPTVNYSSYALYGGTLPYFSVLHPDVATQIYQTQIASIYDPGSGKLKQTLSYYDNNWVWFGTAFYSRSLQKLDPSGRTS